MTARERKSWEYFELINGPIGGFRADWHAAQIVQMLCAINSGVRGSERDAPSVEDCRLEFKTVFPPTPEELAEGARENLQRFVAKWR